MYILLLLAKPNSIKNLIVEFKEPQVEAFHPNVEANKNIRMKAYSHSILKGLLNPIFQVYLQDF
jgi:hypothetical protein